MRLHSDPRAKYIVGMHVRDAVKRVVTDKGVSSVSQSRVTVVTFRCDDSEMLRVVAQYRAARI